MHPKDLLEANLDLVEKIIGFTSRRHGWSDVERDDFGSYVKLKLIDNDYGVLRKFRGTAKLRTYLTVVIHRLLLDYQNHKWGKWRPSAKARNAGPVAVQLETLTARDGYSLNEAIETLRTNHQVPISEEKLRKIASSLPAGPLVDSRGRSC